MMKYGDYTRFLPDSDDILNVIDL